MEKDYFGDGGYINGLGFRVAGTRPVAVLDTEISKSVLTELDKDEEEELKKKRGITELQDIDVEEVSYVDVPATRQKFMIIKGDEDEMLLEKLKVKEGELKVLKQAIKILDGYDLDEKLTEARNILVSNFGESEVKKYNERCEWSTVQNQLYGFCEDDLNFISDDIEIEKGSPDDKFPTLTRQFNLNQRRLEKAYEEYELESRLV